MTNPTDRIRERVAADAAEMEARIRADLEASGGDVGTLDEALASADELADAMGADRNVMRMAAMLGDG